MLTGKHAGGRIVANREPDGGNDECQVKQMPMPLDIGRRRELVAFAAELAHQVQDFVKTPQEQRLLTKAFMLMIDGLY